MRRRSSTPSLGSIAAGDVLGRGRPPRRARREGDDPPPRRRGSFGEALGAGGRSRRRGRGWFGFRRGRDPDAEVVDRASAHPSRISKQVEQMQQREEEDYEHGRRQQQGAGRREQLVRAEAAARAGAEDARGRRRQEEEGARVTESSLEQAIVAFVRYLVFLILYVAFSTRSSSDYWANDAMKQLFVEGPSSGAVTHEKTLDVHFVGQFFVAEGPFLERVPPGSSPERFLHGYSRIIGPVRLRQLRMKPGSCSIPPMFESVVDACYAPYWIARTRRPLARRRRPPVGLLDVGRARRDDGRRAVRALLGRRVRRRAATTNLTRARAATSRPSAPAGGSTAW